MQSGFERGRGAISTTLGPRHNGPTPGLLQLHLPTQDKESETPREQSTRSPLAPMLRHPGPQNSLPTWPEAHFQDLYGLFLPKGGPTAGVSGPRACPGGSCLSAGE